MEFLKDENKSILFQWDVDGDGDLDFVGEGDSLWWGDDLNDVNVFYKNEGEDLQVFISRNSKPTAIAASRRIGNDYIIEWFDFNSSIKSFELKWKQNLKNMNGSLYIFEDYYNEEGVKASINGDEYYIKSDTIIYEGKRKTDEVIGYYLTEWGDNYMFYYNPIDNNNFIVGENGRREIYEIEDIAQIDLNNDRKVNLIVLTRNGEIHVFDRKFNYTEGFPIVSDAIPPVLAIDLLKDGNPEIVFQSSNGIINIMDHEGNILDQYSVTDNSKLIALGVVNELSSIITKSSIYKFKNYRNHGINEWVTRQGEADRSRTLKITKDFEVDETLFYSDLSYAYPNPSYGEEVIFRIQVGIVETIEINIFDLAGFPVERKIKRSPLPLTDKDTRLADVVEISWDVSDLQSGVYLARVVVSKDGKSEEKIIKVGVIK
jgi:hypothetical protein